MGQIKLSFHYTDGYCQHGFTQPVRDLLTTGPDRGALDRWEQRTGAAGIPELAYSVHFSGSELLYQDGKLGSSTLIVPSSQNDLEITVALFFTEPPQGEWPPGRPLPHRLVRLPLPSGATADVVWWEHAKDDSLFEDAVHLYYNAMQVRELPTLLSKTPLFGYASGGLDEARRYTVEIALDPTRAIRLLTLLEGRLRVDAYQAPADPSSTSEITVSSSRYVRLSSRYLRWVELGRTPIYLHEDLEVFDVETWSPYDDIGEQGVADRVFRALSGAIANVVLASGGQSLFTTHTVGLPSGVLGFCVLALPRGEPTPDLRLPAAPHSLLEELANAATSLD